MLKNSYICGSLYISTGYYWSRESVKGTQEIPLEVKGIGRVVFVKEPNTLHG